MRLLILVRGSVRMPMTILMVVSLAPPGRGGFAGDFLALFFMGAGSVELYRYRIFGGPGQWERNLRKVSPPHPLFQRAHFPAAVVAGIGRCGPVAPQCGGPPTPRLVFVHFLLFLLILFLLAAVRAVFRFSGCSA